MVTVRVRVCDTDEPVRDLLLLRRWLDDERALTGAVRVIDTEIGGNDLGGVVDVLEVAAASGGALTVLAGAISTWLKHRRVDLEITLVDADGASRSMVYKGVDDPTEVVEKFLDHGN